MKKGKNKVTLEYWNGKKWKALSFNSKSQIDKPCMSVTFDLPADWKLKVIRKASKKPGYFVKIKREAHE